jgi:signal transduction histidine kinase
LKKLPLFKELLNILKTDLYPNSTVFSTELASTLLGFVLIAVLLLFITGYFIISAMINYSRNYDLREAFKLRKVLKLVLNLKYFAFYLLTIIYSNILLFFSLFILSPIPFIGSYLYPGVYLFVSGVTQHALLSFIASEILTSPEKTNQIQQIKEIKEIKQEFKTEKPRNRASTSRKNKKKK